MNATFWAPLYREWILCLGFCSANKSTLLSRLKAKESIVLVPGGAKEALYAHPGMMKLTIKNRKGFVRLAMEADAKLVPCLGFGENEVFDTLYFGHDPSNDHETTAAATTTTTSPISKEHHSWLWKLQHQIQGFLSFSIPILTHVLPKKVPIDVVVGAPVVFPENASVDECHALYLNALETLYNQHKMKYGYDHVEIEFV